MHLVTIHVTEQIVRLVNKSMSSIKHNRTTMPLISSFGYGAGWVVIFL